MNKRKDKKVSQNLPRRVPLEIIENRHDFQTNRVPQLAEEFKLKKVVVELNTFNFHGIVAIAPMDFSAKCEHHTVGIHGKIYFAYIPGTYVIGLSQVARICESYLNVTKEIIQEQANKDLADYINNLLEPQGLWLVIKATHECMSARGVRQRNTKTATSEIRGNFHESGTRKEARDLWLLD